MTPSFSGDGKGEVYMDREYSDPEGNPCVSIDDFFPSVNMIDPGSYVLCLFSNVFLNSLQILPSMVLEGPNDFECRLQHCGRIQRRNFDTPRRLAQRHASLLCFMSYPSHI